MDAAADGALVADVARRDDITRQHIYQWRRELRDKAQPSIEQSNFVAVIGCTRLSDDFKIKGCGIAPREIE